MNQNLLSHWGTAKERVLAGISSLQQGRGIIVVDDANRENEGDLIFAAESITAKQMALLIRECSGIVCLCLPQDKAQSLDLPPMVVHNTSAYGTAFTVTIEAAEGVTTGVSASDRVTTIRAAVAHSAKAADLRRPGHIFPLISKAQGVLERPGHTEATVDMMRLAGLNPCGVLCEVTNEDGTMARLPELSNFAQAHSIPLLSVEDIIAFRQEQEGLDH